MVKKFFLLILFFLNSLNAMNFLPQKFGADATREMKHPDDLTKILEPNSQKKQLISSDHPALEADPNGICHLGRLPSEILNIILDFIVGQTNHEFLEEAKTFIQRFDSGEEITKSEGNTYIDKWGNLKIRRGEGARDDYLIYAQNKTDPNLCLDDSKRITNFDVSLDSVKICAAERMADDNALTAIYIVDLVEHCVTKISELPKRFKVSGLPLEYRIIKREHIKDINRMERWKSLGYSIDYRYHHIVTLYNRFDKIFMGPDFVVVANNNAIYVAQMDVETKKWGIFKLLKKIFPAVIKLLLINGDNSKLGICVNDGSIIIVDRKKIRSLSDYFYKNRICKKFSTKEQPSKINRDNKKLEELD